MAKLLFDPVTYQFHYRCRSEESAPAIAAGFGWDSIRRRYSTDDPAVAMALARYGDNYVRRLLADTVESPVLLSTRGEVRSNRQYFVPPSISLH